MIFHDLVQAILDLGLVLFLTALLLALLFLAGWWLKRRSLKIQIKADRMAQYAHQMEKTTQLNHSANFWQGMSTELFGAVVTTLAFGVVLLVFQQYQSNQNRKAELILQMGSPDNAFAVEAVRQLRALGWLYDETLQGVDLVNANLQDVNLWNANLQGVDLKDANLQRAFLRIANLQGTRLVKANLQGAYLGESNLQETDLRYANLQGVNLWNANLQGADLMSTIFSADTILPDAVWDVESQQYTSNSYWTPDTDMTRYTDPNHPDFWQPDWVKGD